VILAARSFDQLRQHAERLNAQGARTGALALDISAPQTFDAALASLPPVDILVNVSGMNKRKPFAEYSGEEYRQIMQTNLDGLFQLTQKVGQRMIERGQGGKIIFIGSVSAIRTMPYLTVYAASKAALGGLTQALAAEWGRHNIQVNLIAPGFCITDLNREMWQAPEMITWLKSVQPTPRTATPEEIAPLAVFLAGRGSDYITGQSIAVDGGYSTCAVWPYAPPAR